MLQVIRMGAAERRTRTKEALRQSILSAALDILATEGYAALSMRRIAARIEYSPSAIYLHFNDKAEIVAALCEETCERMSAELSRVIAHYVDPVEGLRNALRCYVDFGTAHPAHYLVAFGQLPPGRLRDGAGGCLRCFATLQNAVRNCVDSGRTVPMDVNLLSESIWASIHGLTSLMITHAGDAAFPWVDRELLIENTLNVVLRGVLVDPEESSRRYLHALA
jgi:AcrR family transcriptional regulator